MKDLELDLLKNAEFKEAFDEFDKVALSHHRVVQLKVKMKLSQEDLLQIIFAKIHA